MWWETFRLALSSLLGHRLRALLTTLGVVFGTMAIIAVVSIVQGVFHVYASQLEGLGAGFLFAVPGNPSALERVRRGARLSAHDADEIARSVDSVLAVTPYFFDRRTITLRGQKAEAGLMPTFENYQQVQNHFVSQGRFFTAMEVRTRARVVVLGPDLAEQLGLHDAVGETVRIYGAPFTVIGVMEEKNGINAMGQDYDTAAILPHPTALSFVNPNRNGLLLIKLTSVDDVERVQQEIRRVLRRVHRLGPDEPDDFQLITQGEVLKNFEEISGIATWVVLAMVSVALLVGGIGIMNIMLVSVTERTREIGVRKAMGARRGDILAQFLVEATLLGVLGGVLGIVLGLAVAWLVSAVVPDFPPPFVPAWAVALAFGFSAGVGVVFGLWPAARAARLDPIESLRFE